MLRLEKTEQADFTSLCIVWLQCSFGIKHPSLLQCARGQVHLCPVARYTVVLGPQVFKAWNPLLPLLQKCVLQLGKYLPNFGQSRTVWGTRR